MLCAENRDVTDEKVLSDPAAQSGLEQDRCLPAFRSDEAIPAPCATLPSRKVPGSRAFRL